MQELLPNLFRSEYTNAVFRVRRLDARMNDKGEAIVHYETAILLTRSATEKQTLKKEITRLTTNDPSHQNT